MKNNPLITTDIEESVLDDVTITNTLLATNTSSGNNNTTNTTNNYYAHDNPADYCENGAKINRANDEGLLNKDNILFALDTPTTANKANILTTIKRTFDSFQINHIN